jgi:mannose-6-phosphate isomerase-like protein (cupin superfamily)
MFIIDPEKKKTINAGDGTRLKELLSPRNDPVNTRYSLALARVAPNSGSVSHMLKSSSEVYIIVAGEGIVHVGDEARHVREGNIIYIPPGTFQHIENTGPGDLVFYCIVDPPWHQEDEVVIV